MLKKREFIKKEAKFQMIRYTLFFYHVYSDSLPHEICYRIIDDRKDLVTQDFQSTQVKWNKRRFIQFV
jgi:hypothetical protein